MTTEIKVKIQIQIKKKLNYRNTITEKYLLSVADTCLFCSHLNDWFVKNIRVEIKNSALNKIH